MICIAALCTTGDQYEMARKSVRMVLATTLSQQPHLLQARNR